MSGNYDDESECWDGEGRKYVKPTKANFKKETMKEVEMLDSGDWPERGLREETLKRFGVKVKYSSEMGPKRVEKVYFPFRDQRGKICGYKVKNLLKDKSEKFHFYAVGHVGVDCQLWGQDTVRKSGKILYICEGEVDTLSLYQAILDGNGEKYQKLTPPVVGIGCGTVNAVDHVASNSRFLKKYRKEKHGVVLCFDNDRLTDAEKAKKNPGMKGWEATVAVGNHLMSHDVQYIQWPDYINDVSDYLQKGIPDKLRDLVVFNGSEYQTEEIVGLYDMFKPGELAEPMQKGVYLDAFPKLMEKLLGIRKGELTLMMAPSGVGKSSVSAEIAHCYAKEQGRVGGIFLEEGMKKTCNRFISRKLKIHPNKYKWGPLDHCTPEQFSAAEKWVGDTDRFLFLDHYGSIRIESLVDLAKILIHKHKRELIVLDHISLTVSGKDDIDERVELEKAMTELATLCENSDVHIIVVAHINRQASTTTKDEREIKKPKWKRCFITDGKGTQALEALAWNIICIDMELMPDGTRGRIRLFLGKNREADELGFCDVVRMDKSTGVFYDASDEKWSPPTEEY